MNYKRLAICLVLPQLAGLIGSFFTASAISVWYAGLVKPGFNPPNWVFGPVWIALYILMGISIYLVWPDKKAFYLFWIHLIFNAGWSIVFFGLRSPGLALINIIIIWLFIIVLMFRFYKINKWAFYLLVPYFIWVSFASVLNYFIYVLN